jgi:hypothetical protein
MARDLEKFSIKSNSLMDTPLMNAMMIRACSDNTKEYNKQHSESSH